VDREHGVNRRAAVDIGGTFTDVAVIDGETGDLSLAKADTTAGHLDDGVMTALERSAADPRGIEQLIHGTTVVINAITERRGVETALVTTRGFRDVLLIGRANRPDLYNLSYRKPEPFVPRRRCFEVTERMSYRGHPLEPIAVEELERIGDELRSGGIRGIAICFLHSWANQTHERIAMERLSELVPGAAVVASHEVSAQWREYERTSTTVLSAYVKPVVADYLSSLERRRSGGGVASFRRATAAPIELLESGPVAGVAAAAEAGRRVGARHVLALDIGGTTAKTSAVRDGRMRVETLHHVERTPTSAGHPIQAPVVEIVEIGAGGGSIAWVDAAGGLHVGPRSAGAEPGPACYARGGTEATLTDANLVAGRIDPGYFLGGSMPLQLGAAREAFDHLGSSLGGIDATTAARGVLRYAVSEMAHALRLVTVRRGHDPRDFTFVAYGGAGPLHAAFLARELNIARTLIPPAPGHFSAFGMLLGGLSAGVVRTHVGPLDAESLTQLFAELEKEAVEALEDRSTEVRIDRFLELRYSGQEHSIEVPVPPGPMDAASLASIRDELDRRSEEAYAFSLTVDAEVVAGRVTASTGAGDVRWPAHADAGRVDLAPRAVDFDQYGEVVTAEVLHRGSLEPGRSVAGPCVVEEPASTTVVLPGQFVTKDDLGNLLIEEAPT
jgi:N-methylhydantoinase A